MKRLKKLTAKPRRKRKSIILTMKYVLDVYEDDDTQAQRIGKMFKAWMRDKFSKWDDAILDYFLYDNNIVQNSENDRLSLDSFMDKIIKDDCDHAEEREIEEFNLKGDNKDTSSSEASSDNNTELTNLLINALRNGMKKSED